MLPSAAGTSCACLVRDERELANKDAVTEIAARFPDQLLGHVTSVVLGPVLEWAGIPGRKDESFDPADRSWRACARARIVEAQARTLGVAAQLVAADRRRSSGTRAAHLSGAAQHASDCRVRRRLVAVRVGDGEDQEPERGQDTELARHPLRAHPQLAEHQAQRGAEAVREHVARR